MAILLVLLGCCANYLLVVWLFKRELRIAEDEIVKELILESIRSAPEINREIESIEDSLEDSVRPVRQGIGGGRRVVFALEEVLQKHQSIIFIMLTDLDGMIRLKSNIKSEYSHIEKLIEGEETYFGVRDEIDAKYPRLWWVTTDAKLSVTSSHKWRVLVDPQAYRRLDTVFELADEAMVSKLIRSVLIAMALVIFVFIGMLRQKRTADRLRRQRDEAERMAYVGTLASGLAHEIRNPINALAMQLEMIEEDMEERAAPGFQGEPGVGEISVGQPKGPSFVARLRSIRDGLSRLERSVQDFLTFARPGDQKPSTVWLYNIIHELFEETEASNPGRTLDLSHTVQPRLALWCDVHALRQIIGNLLSNAVRIQMGRNQCIVRIEARRQNRTIVILVDDAGPGVSVQNRERIFECFFTTHPGGSGLGLAIARRLTEMNGGELKSLEGGSSLGGARFSLTLPVAEKS